MSGLNCTKIENMGRNGQPKKSKVLKIGSLNCHGMRDKVDYPEFLKLVSTTDIFGVCETWLKENDDIHLPGYKFYPQNRKKEAGPSKGGIGFFINNNIKKHVKIRYDLSSENFLICRILKKILGFNDDTYVAIVYIPPELSSREKRLKKDHFKHLIEITSKINSNNIILVGDFNARTAGLDDTLKKDKHDILVPDFYTRIESKRSNQDLTRNKYGTKLIEYCVATGSYIANGRTLGDLQGKFTCHQKNGSSTVDYAVVNESLHHLVRKFMVLDLSLGSDHCPIVIDIDMKTEKELSNSEVKDTLPSIPWNDKTRMLFLNKLSSDEVQNSLKEIENLVDSNAGNIDDIIIKLTDIFNVTPTTTKRKKKSRPPLRKCGTIKLVTK